MSTWVRSWPATIPPGRRYVVDNLPMLVIDGHDYAGAFTTTVERRGVDIPSEPGVFVVEWDIAYEPVTVAAMEAAAAADPQRVHVAPYQLHPASTGLSEAVWAHSDGVLPGERWTQTGQVWCDNFALGLAYLPWRLITEFLGARRTLTDPRMTDTNLSMFHAAHWRQRVHVVWAARPVIHLHW